MTKGEPKIGPRTATPMAMPRLRRNQRARTTGQVTAWLAPDAPSETTTNEPKNMTMLVERPRPIRPAETKTALTRRIQRALTLSSRNPTAGLTMPDSSWRRDMAAEMTERFQPKCRSMGRNSALKPWK